VNTDHSRLGGHALVGRLGGDGGGGLGEVNFAIVPLLATSELPPIVLSSLDDRVGAGGFERSIQGGSAAHSAHSLMQSSSFSPIGHHDGEREKLCTGTIVISATAC